MVAVTDDGCVCTTADIWTGGGRRFLEVTVSWIESKSLSRKAIAIACRRFPGTHSFDAIADQLSAIHTSYNLKPENIIATVTDNGSNFVKAFAEFGLQYTNDSILEDSNLSESSENDDEDIDESMEREDFDPECEIKLSRHLRCASHTLSLTATSDIPNIIKNSRGLCKRHSNVYDKCKTSWKALRSPKKRELLKEILGKSLQVPVVTRWNSLYDCFTQLLSFKDKLLNNKNIPIDELFIASDFTYLEEYVASTSSLAYAIDKLQGDNCYYGMLLPELLNARTKLSKLMKDPNITICQSLIQGIEDSITRRFESFFKFDKVGEFAAIASLSHPRFKGLWMISFSKETQQKIYNLFQSTVSDMRNIIESNSQHETDNEYDFGGDKSNIIPKFRTSATQVAVETEVTNYLSSSNKNLEMLSDFPTIRNVFIKFNTPLPSSAPVERLFSYATILNLPKFNRLTDENFEKRVLAKANSAKSYL